MKKKKENLQKIIRIFLIMAIYFASFSGAGFCENNIILKPQKLKLWNTLHYKKVNNLASAAFNGFNDSINTGIYSPKLDTSNKNTKIKKDALNHFNVKGDNVELNYDDKENLYQVIINTGNTYPKTSYQYSFPDGKLTGVIVYLTEDEFYMYTPAGKYFNGNAYVKRVSRKSKKEWNPPRQYVETKRSVVIIDIGANGKVNSEAISESSKDPAFDKSASDAIIKASPYDPSPFNLILLETFKYNVIGRPLP